jgi:uncharacterized membrane protein HdeD (DUF308 family)
VPEHRSGRPTETPSQAPTSEEHDVIILGIVLIVIGLFAKIAILETLGLVLLVVGVVLMLLGSTGRAVAGRRHYW